MDITQTEITKTGADKTRRQGQGLEIKIPTQRAPECTFAGNMPYVEIPEPPWRIMGLSLSKVISTLIGVISIYYMYGYLT